MFTLKIIEWINRALMGASNNVTYESIERNSKGTFLCVAKTHNSMILTFKYLFKFTSLTLDCA